MDFSKLDSNEKLAVYGAIASVVGPILASMGFGFGIGWLTLILALAMLAIVFLPQMSPGTTLPGSKGTLMLIVGGIAAISAALALLSSIGFLGFFGSNFVFVIGWLLGIVGGLLMGWAGWQAFQAEGSKFVLGTPAHDTTADRREVPPDATAGATPPPPPATTAAPPPTATTAAPPPAEPPPAYDETDEERRDRT